MISRSRRRNKAWKRLFWGALLVTVVGYNAPTVLNQFMQIDVEKILAESPLKNKKFAAQVKEVKSGNLSAYLMEEHSNPIVSLSFSFKNSGASYVEDGKTGLASITAEMLTMGAGQFTEEQFQDLCDEYGIKISFSADNDDFSGYLATPTENIDIAVELLVAALNKPLLEADKLQLVKRQVLAALRLQTENPRSVLNNAYREFVFSKNCEEGECHPYSRNSIGKAEDIEKISATDIEKFMQDHFSQNNLIIGVAGDINAEQTGELLEKIFGELPKDNTVKILDSYQFASAGMQKNVASDRQLPQTITRFVSEGTYRNSLDFYPLYLANYIFGEASLSSRLAKKVRIEGGLTYGISTSLAIYDATALLVGNFASTPENFAKAKEIIKDEWLLMGQNGVTDEELDVAKKSLINSFNLRFSSIANLSDMLVSMQKYQLGIDFLERRNDYIAETSRKSVNAAAKKYFSTLPDFVSIGVNLTEVE